MEFENTKPSVADHNTVKFRDMKNFDMESFSNDLISCDILNGSLDDDISEETWKLAYTDICDKHAPTKSLRQKERSNPWMTHDIICMILYERDHIHTKATQSNDSRLWQDYRNLRNKVTCIIKERKNVYFNDIHIHSAEMTPKCGRKLNDSYIVKINNRILLFCELCDISANDFNHHFANISNKMNSKFSWQLFLEGPKSIHSFRFKEMSNIWDLYLINPIMIYWA